MPHPDGGTVFTVPVVLESAFCFVQSQILDHAEVLEPAEFRSAVITWPEQLAVQKNQAAGDRMRRLLAMMPCKLRERSGVSIYR
ncbi:MAG: hypothetical protein R2706_09060 [Acidimicrobiales bacterium]